MICNVNGKWIGHLHRDEYPDAHNEGCLGMEKRGELLVQNFSHCLNVPEHLRVCPDHQSIQAALNQLALNFTGQS
jgi:hypothetical protein